MGGYEGKYYTLPSVVLCTTNFVNYCIFVCFFCFSFTQVSTDQDVVRKAFVRVIVLQTSTNDIF